MFLAEGPAGSPAAVKLLPPTTDPQVRSRFLKEVAAAQRVARFCTAQVLDAGIFERRPFIVSEYVSGPSLVEVVEQLGPRGGAALERIAVATLTALGAVHAAGMVHRDFKPGNVLLGPDGPVVIDFGLAAVPGMTTMGPSGQVAIGTPAFMAPEQLAGTRVTAAADMWSWAVTMAFAGTGELPFKGESLTATAYAILHSEPNVGRLPEPLGSLVHRCLNKDPAVRPSARGALSELVAAGARLMGPMPPMASALATDEKTASSEQVLAAPPEPRAGSGDGLIGGGLASRPRRRRRENGRASRRRRAAVLLTVILLVAGAGGLAFTLSRRGASSGAANGQPASRPAELAAEAAARTQAITWILHQVSPAAVVSCDAQVCADLASSGFPSANLLPLGPGVERSPRLRPGGGHCHCPEPVRQPSGRLRSGRHRELRHGKRQDRHQVGLSRRRRGVSRRPTRGAARQEGCRRPAAEPTAISGSPPQPGHSSSAARLTLGCRSSSPSWPIAIRCASWTSPASRLAADLPASCGGWTWRRRSGRRTSRVRHISAGCGRSSTRSEPSTIPPGCNRSRCVLAKPC